MNKIFGFFILIIGYFLLWLYDTLVIGFLMLTKSDTDVPNLFISGSMLFIGILTIYFVNDYSYKLISKPDPGTIKKLKNKILIEILISLFLLAITVFIIILDISVINLLKSSFIHEERVSPLVPYIISIILPWVILIIKKNREHQIIN